MRTLFAALLSVLLAACSTVTQSPLSYYRAAGAADQITIGGTITQSPWGITGHGHTHAVEITINGETVIRGDMGNSSSQDYDATWNGRKITAACMVLASDKFMNPKPSARCLVFVNGERAGTVSM